MAITDNIVDYWKFNDTLGCEVRANDMTGNYTGYVAGILANGLDLDGSNDSIVSTSVSGVTGNAARSLNAWVKFNTFKTDCGVISLGTYDGTNKWWGLCQSGTAGEIRCYTNNGYNFVAFTAAEIDTGTWYMMTMTYDGTTTRTYLNGVAKGTGTGQTLATTNTGARAGSLSDVAGTYSDMVLDEYGVWTKQLSQEEITALYNAGVGLTYPFTTGWSKKIFGITGASKINGVALSSISKVNGV